MFLFYFRKMFRYIKNEDETLEKLISSAITVKEITFNSIPYVLIIHFRKQKEYREQTNYD